MHCGCKPGDYIALFFGSNALHTIREENEKIEGAPVSGLVGDAYMQGMMSGEAIEMLRSGEDPGEIHYEAIKLI